MRALVVALNPSIDVEWRVERIRREEKNVVQSERRWPGGKGVNVARWLRHLGGQPLLLLPLGGQTGGEMAAGLRREKLAIEVIPLREPTRANIIISASAGGQMRFNPPGPKLSRHEWNEVLKAVIRSLERMCSEQGRGYHSGRAAPSRSDHDALGLKPPAHLLILSGSLPRGVPVTAYAQLIRLAQSFGVRTLLDCDGPVFVAAIKARPFLVKPNVHELAEWWGRPLRSLADVRRAAIRLSRITGGWVLVSRGAKGACLISRQNERCFAASSLRVKVRNTVGAGDALLAAVAREIDRCNGPGDWLRWGVAVGTAAAQCAAGELPKPASVERLLARIRARMFPK